MRSLVLVLLVACAPVVDGPIEKQRISDRSDGDRLAAQLSALPGVVRTEVMLRRPVRDPLGVAPAAAAAASIVVIVDDQADRTATLATTKRLAAAAAPKIEPTIVVEVGAVRPVMAKLGPFTVEARSKGPLKIVLAIALGVLALLSGWIAWRARPVREPS